ncbi:MAG: hypothetical protein HY231_05985 [Acidobacteria bacterium]|nr:hypothetical protein [Acidobacteriota bacterium]
MRIKLRDSLLLFTLLVSLSIIGQAQTSPTPPQLSIDDVIQRFAAAESQNKAARLNYTFTQNFDMMEIGEAGSIIGRFHRVSDIVLDNHGNRLEKITFFPPSTLKNLILTREDMQDLAEIQPFGLTTETLPKYQVTFLRKEKIDELTTYVFEVKPKQLVKGERYLEGRIWVDDVDLQIVKVAGKSIPDTEKNVSPHFESYRENIDGKYWFPTYIYADDVLEFKRGNSVHMRLSVKFTSYKKFSTGIRVSDDPGEEATEEGDKVKKPESAPTINQPNAPATTTPKKPETPAPAITTPKKPETPAPTTTKKPAAPVTKKPLIE